MKVNTEATKSASMVQALVSSPDGDARAPNRALLTSHTPARGRMSPNP